MSQSAKKEWRQYAVIFLCALVATLPLAIRGNSCGHDFDFHIQSWLAAAWQWRHGMLYPHWIDGANYGAGEPRFVFYPPLSWMLGALLGTILRWTATPAAFTLIVLTGCGVSMNKLAREWLPANAAAVSACAYILNPYALFVAYERTAYAELAAGILLPLIILCALRGPMNRCHAERSAAGAQSKDLQFHAFTTNTVPLALTIAAIWLTNAPAAVMACYALAAITLWKSITENQWQPVVQTTISLILGLGLASFYIIPAAYERRWVDITRAIGPGMRIEDSFLFGHTGESFHDQVLHTASLIFVTMLVAIYVFVSTARRRKTAQHLLLPLSVTAAVLFALQLPWSNPIWRLAPELRFLQFPWRWTLMLSIVFALSLGAALATRTIPPRKPKFRSHAIAILFVAIAAVSLGTHFFWQPCDEEDVVSNQTAIFRETTGFEGTDEYTPVGADNSIIQQFLPPIRVLKTADAETSPSPASEDQSNPTYTPTTQDQVSAEIQSPIPKFFLEHKTLSITTQSPGYAIIRLIDYPAWQVLANGATVLNRPHRDDGLMVIPVRSGLTRIEIRYVATPDVWWGRGLSAASVLALLTIALASQKRREVV